MTKTPSTPSVLTEPSALTPSALTERAEQVRNTEPSVLTERTLGTLTDEHAARALARITECRAVNTLSRLYRVSADTLGAHVLGSLALSAPDTERRAALLTLAQVAPSESDISHALATVRGVSRQYLARTYGNAPSAERTGESTEHDDADESAERAPVTECRAWLADRLALGAAVLRAMHGHHSVTRSARGRKCEQCKGIGSAVLSMMGESHRWEWSERVSTPSETTAERVHSLALTGALAADGESVRADHDPARRALTLSKVAERTLSATLDRSAVLGSAVETEPSARAALTEHVRAVALATKRERAPRERTLPTSLQLLSEQSLETLLSRALRVHSDRTNTDEHAERYTRKMFGRVFVRADALAVLTLTPRTRRITEHACAAFGTLGAAALFALDATTERENVSSVLTESTVERSVIRSTELLRAIGIEPSSANRDALGSVLLSLAHYSLSLAEVLTRESVPSVVERDALRGIGIGAEHAERRAESNRARTERVRAAMVAERVSAFGALALSTLGTPRATYTPSRVIRYTPSAERFAEHVPSTPSSAQWFVTPNGRTFGRLRSV